GYGYEDITVGRLLVGMYGGYMMIGAALMSIMTVSRHTRVEEQTGRAELVRANVVGRHAQLFAAFILVGVMNLLMTLLMAAAFHFSPVEPESVVASLLFACSTCPVAIAFAARSAVPVQLSTYAPPACASAGAMLGTTLRADAHGDCSVRPSARHDSLSWHSPSGSAQRTATLTPGPWWTLTS